VPFKVLYWSYYKARDLYVGSEENKDGLGRLDEERKYEEGVIEKKLGLKANLN